MIESANKSGSHFIFNNKAVLLFTVGIIVAIATLISGDLSKKDRERKALECINNLRQLDAADMNPNLFDAAISQFILEH